MSPHMHACRSLIKELNSIRFSITYETDIRRTKCYIQFHQCLSLYFQVSHHTQTYPIRLRSYSSLQNFSTRHEKLSNTKACSVFKRSPKYSNQGFLVFSFRNLGLVLSVQKSWKTREEKLQHVEKQTMPTKSEFIRGNCIDFEEWKYLKWNREISRVLAENDVSQSFESKKQSHKWKGAIREKALTWAHRSNRSKDHFRYCFGLYP